MTCRAHASKRSIMDASKPANCSLTVRLDLELPALTDRDPALLLQPLDLAPHRLARNAGGRADRQRIAVSQMRQVVTGFDQAVEPRLRVAGDLVVVALDVVLGDRGQDDRRSEVTVEQLVGPDEVVGDEPADQVGKFAAALGRGSGGHGAIRYVPVWTASLPKMGSWRQPGSAFSLLP